MSRKAQVNVRGFAGSRKVQGLKYCAPEARGRDRSKYFGESKRTKDTAEAILEDVIDTIGTTGAVSTSKSLILQRSMLHFVVGLAPVDQAAKSGEGDSH